MGLLPHRRAYLRPHCIAIVVSLNEGWGFCPTDALLKTIKPKIVNSLNEGWGFCPTDADRFARPSAGLWSLNEGWGFCPTDADELAVSNVPS